MMVFGHFSRFPGMRFFQHFAKTSFFAAFFYLLIVSRTSFLASGKKLQNYL